MAKKRILIIDDEFDFVKMLTTRLQIAGYEVLAAEDGPKGVQTARREKPDLIILDIMMPGMNGHAVCDMLKKSTLTWAIPVIYLTARTSQADELLGLEKGAKYYLTKPYNPDVLLEMVKSALMEQEEAGQAKGNILVIDKDLNFVNEIEPKLKQAGYNVSFSSTAKEGLKAAFADQPDVILMDFLTSRDDGHDSIRRLSADESLKHIPLFILAPKTFIQKMNQTTPHLEKFIAKPVNYAGLLETLARALEQKKA
ncbi:MAG: response regulator [Clostridiales bacterium]|nr:response regulator [Clostridiales bacterium]